MTNIQIWKPVACNDSWLKADTRLLDSILPSWKTINNQELQKSRKYKDFIEKLKREHVLETGIIEGIYDLNSGITETLIREGIVENSISHGDVGIISKSDLMKILRDHEIAIDYIFDLVKNFNKRGITTSVIKELHQLVTQNQKVTDAKDPNGNYISIELIKGRWKIHPNNPVRGDTTCFYCPPEQTASEMDSLISIYNQLQNNNVHPIIIASWFHHAFTSIHPFQDGNGRVVRLLTSSILLYNNLFPFTVTRKTRKEYISALEEGDRNNPERLVTFFCNNQRGVISNFLNVTTDYLNEQRTLMGTVSNLEKIAFDRKNRSDPSYRQITEARESVFNDCKIILNELIKIINITLNKGIVEIKLDQSIDFNNGKYYWWGKDIIEIANANNYYYRKNLPRAWFKIDCTIESIVYSLIITLHHFGSDSNSIAIAGFINCESLAKDAKQESNYRISVSYRPYELSLINYGQIDLTSSIKSYLESLINFTLVQVTSELSD
ncbi:MAG: Fic family protein [Methylacidiphilales bacterium]|nr:Fic family protein [Candidatus Methylacidiphilales bacterium]